MFYTKNLGFTDDLLSDIGKIMEDSEKVRNRKASLLSKYNVNSEAGLTTEQRNEYEKALNGPEKLSEEKKPLNESAPKPTFSTQNAKDILALSDAFTTLAGQKKNADVQAYMDTIKESLKDSKEVSKYIDAMVTSKSPILENLDEKARTKLALAMYFAEIEKE